MIQPLWRTVWRFLKKLKVKQTYYPATPLLGIYPEKSIIQKNNEIPSHTSQNGHYFKNLYVTNAGEGVEKREPSYTVRWECKLVQPLWKTVWRLL